MVMGIAFLTIGQGKILFLIITEEANVFSLHLKFVRSKVLSLTLWTDQSKTVID